jgi:hypothetical protein
MEIIAKKERNEPVTRKECTLKEFWDYFLPALQKNINSSIAYCKNLPGFSQLSEDDFKRTVTERVFMIITLRVAKLCINEEFYLFLSLDDGVYFARDLMDKAYGHELCEGFFEFFRKFNSLNLTTHEISVLIPAVISNFGNLKFKNSQVLA